MQAFLSPSACRATEGGVEAAPSGNDTRWGARAVVRDFAGTLAGRLDLARMLCRRATTGRLEDEHRLQPESIL